MGTIQKNQQSIIWSVGVTGKTTELRVVPHRDGQVRRQIPTAKPVIVFGRDRFCKWVNVLYETSVGEKVTGWIYMADIVKHVSSEGKPAELLDVPLTTFQGNSRDEVKHLHKLIAGSSYGTVYEGSKGLLATLSALGIFGFIGMAMGFPSLSIGFLVAAGISAIVFFTLYGQATKAAEQQHINDPDYLTSEQRKQWATEVQNYLNKTKPSSEKLGDFLKAAAGAAVVVGGAAAAAKYASTKADRTHQSNLASKGGYMRVDVKSKRR